jgi:hypothetical protein
VAALVLLLDGCAQLPPCPVARIVPFTLETGQTLHVFDAVAIEAVRQRLLGLEEGTCQPQPHWAIAVQPE